jgi:LacI family transcriptional regulator
LLKDRRTSYAVIPRKASHNARGVVGLVVADSSNPFFAKVVKGIEDTLNQQGYSLILCNTDEDYGREKKSIEVLVGHGVDGIILTPTQLKSEDIAYLVSKKKPFVLLGRHFKEYSVPNVIGDDRGGANKAIDHLLRLGHRQMLFINASGYISSAEERLQGYQDAFLENGLNVDRSLIRWCEPRMEAAYNEMSAAVLEGVRFSAVFTFSDLMMLGVIKFLRERSIRIPEDCSLVGFDDIDFVSLMSPPLTTVQQDMIRLGKESASMLLQILSGHEVSNITKVVPTKLVVRGTTMRISEEKSIESGIDS